MKNLEILVSSTKVNYIAISDTPAWIVSMANMMAKERGWTGFIAYQFPYAMVRRDMEHDVIPCAREIGLAMVPWGILAGGLLTGKYTRGTKSGRLDPSNIIPERLEIAQKLDELADELEIESSQLAFAWVKHQHQQMFPIAGVTKPQQLQSVLDAVEISLSQQVLDRIDEFTKIQPSFPQSFVANNNVIRLIHGETYPLLENHQFKGF